MLPGCAFEGGRLGHWGFKTTFDSLWFQKGLERWLWMVHFVACSCSGSIGPDAEFAEKKIAFLPSSMPGILASISGRCSQEFPQRVETFLVRVWPLKELKKRYLDLGKWNRFPPGDKKPFSLSHSRIKIGVICAIAWKEQSNGATKLWGKNINNMGGVIRDSPISNPTFCQ